MADVLTYAYHWTHPVCGHKVLLTDDPRLDLAVPDDFLRALNLPKPGAPMDMYRSYIHPANQKYIADKNPAFPLPPVPDDFEQVGPRTWQYGGLQISKNPNELPFGVTHPAMNEGMDVSPGAAIMGGLENLGAGHESPPGRTMSLGWPGAHVECPECIRNNLQLEFDMVNEAMVTADRNGDDWAGRAKALSFELMKLQNAKAPMPITLNPIRHPEDGPVIRGPKAGDFFGSQGPNNGGNHQVSSHARRRTADYPLPQSGSNSMAGTPSGYATPQPTSGPYFASRSRSGTTSGNVEARPRRGTTPASMSGVPVGPFQAVQAAFAKMDTRGQQDQLGHNQERGMGIGMGMVQRGSQQNPQSPPVAPPPGLNQHQRHYPHHQQQQQQQESKNATVRLPPRFVPNDANNDNGRQGMHSGSKHQTSMSTPNIATSANQTSFQGQVRGQGQGPSSSAPGTPGSFPQPSTPSSYLLSPSGLRSNRAIPIVDPTTRQAKTGGIADYLSPQAGKAQVPIRQPPESPQSMRAPPLNAGKASFASKNPFGALHEEDSDQEAPGGVKL